MTEEQKARELEELEAWRCMMRLEEIIGMMERRIGPGGELFAKHASNELEKLKELCLGKGASDGTAEERS